MFRLHPVQANTEDQTEPTSQQDHVGMLARPTCAVIARAQLALEAMQVRGGLTCRCTRFCCSPWRAWWWAAPAWAGPGLLAPAGRCGCPTAGLAVVLALRLQGYQLNLICLQSVSI